MLSVKPSDATHARTTPSFKNIVTKLTKLSSKKKLRNKFFTKFDKIFVDKSNTALAPLDHDTLVHSTEDNFGNNHAASSTLSSPSFLTANDLATSKIFFASSTATQKEEERKKNDDVTSSAELFTIFEDKLNKATRKENGEEEDTGIDTRTKRRLSAVTNFFMGQENQNSNRGDAIASMSASFHNRGNKLFLGSSSTPPPTRDKAGDNGMKSPTMKHRKLSLMKVADSEAATNIVDDSTNASIDPAIDAFTNGSLLVRVPPLKKKKKKKKPSPPPGMKRRNFLEKKISASRGQIDWRNAYPDSAGITKAQIWEAVREIEDEKYQSMRTYVEPSVTI